MPNPITWNERLRALFRGAQIPDPVPGPDDIVEIPVGRSCDGEAQNEQPPVWLTQTRLHPDIDWEAIRRRVARDSAAQSSHQSDVLRYAMQAPTEDPETRARRQAVRRAMQGATHDSVFIDEAASMWRSHKDGLEDHITWGEKEATREVDVRFRGVECRILPIITLQTGVIEYSKGSPEPKNGTERLEFEKYAMDQIVAWGKKNTQAFK